MGGDGKLRFFQASVPPARAGEPRKLQWDEMQMGQPGSLPVYSGLVNRLAVGTLGEDVLVAATVSGEHNPLVVATAEDRNPIDRKWRTHVVTETGNGVRALACGDFFRYSHIGPHIVIGGVGDPALPNTRGIAIWRPLDTTGETWKRTVIDETISCQDLCLSNMSLINSRGSGSLNIVACGGATHDLKIYINEAPQSLR